MSDRGHERLTVTLRLRPLRIAFLVGGYNPEQARQAIQINTCLWGGMYNPIIPVHKRLPRAWKDHPHDTTCARDVIRAYVQAFEPDFVVGFETSLAEGLGIPPERLLTLADLLEPSDQGPFHVGVSVQHLYWHLYRREFRFRQREEVWVALPTIPRDPTALFHAACFGEFPGQPYGHEALKAYQQAFEANEGPMAPGDLLRDLLGRSEYPLSMGRWDVRVGYCFPLDDPTLFLMDATSPMDAVDFWNLRAFGGQILPVPKQHADLLVSECSKVIAQNYVPYSHNKSMMHHTVLMRSRSTSEEEVKEFAKRLLVPGKGALAIDVCRNFDTTPLRYFLQPERCRVECGEREETTEATGDHIRFKGLAPVWGGRLLFANTPRWANVASFRSDSGDSEIAKVIPPGPTGLAGGFGIGRKHGVSVSSEGVVLLGHYADESHSLKKPTNTEVMTDYFRRQGLTARVSPSGKIMHEVIKRIGGLAWVHTLASEELLKLFNNMAHGTFEEEADDPPQRGGRPRVRAGTVKRATLVEVLKKQHGGDLSTAMRYLAALLECNALRVGLRLKCPHCGQHTWFALDSLSDELECERCLQEFGFPAQDPSNAEWHYRVVGPFAVENYAHGSYVGALALRAIGEDPLLNSLTWMPSFNIYKGDKDLGEIDFAAFCERIGSGHCCREPILFFGECKTYNRFEDRDLERVRRFAEMFPGSVLAFCTLRQALEKREKDRIKSLARKGRERLRGEMWRNPVLVLTATELLDFYGPPHCWKGKQVGGVLANRLVLHDVYELCDITQQMYLGMEAYHSWQDRKFMRLRARLAARKGHQTGGPPSADHDGVGSGASS